MQCHYEVLGIPRDAEDDQIKKSYRKLALKNHPDKNPDDIEGCTKRFHLIQQAYEVLSDPQERAWYDKHREAILKGGLGHGGDYKDDCLNVYEFFNAACFSGYNDGEKGFYTVYKEVFNKIAAEDSEYKGDSDEEIPGFGDSMSIYEDVVRPFYGYWESYFTLRSYVWVEKYDTRDAPNRQTRRAMEQENKKLRDQAKKARNEEVRALVAFVKKRDKRVQAYKKKLEERAAEVARLAKERKEQSRKDRLKALEGYKEADWSAATALEKDLENLEAGYADEFGEDDYSDSDEGSHNLEDIQEEFEEEMYLEEPYCIACNKPFKTEKALANHEKSKKHKERVAALKEELMEEDAEIEAAGDSEEVDLEQQLSDLDLSESEDDRPQKLSKKQKKKKRQQKVDVDELDSNSIDGSINGDESETKNEVPEIFQCIPCEKTFNSVDAMNAHNKTKKHKRTAASYEEQSKKSNQAIKQTSQKEEAQPVEENQASGEGQEKTVPEKDVPEENASQAHGDVDLGESNKSKKVKLPAQANVGSGEPIPCNTCKQLFPSRNKLFDHIKKTGHALRVENNSSVQHEDDGRKSKKKKKGKK